MLSLDLYRSSIRSNLRSNWTYNSTSLTIDSSLVGDVDQWVSERCPLIKRKVMVPKVLIDKDYYFAGGSGCDSFAINVDNISYGIMWTPLIKSIEFTASVNHSEVFNFRKVIDDHNAMQIDYSTGASLHIFGHIDMHGFCSYRTAKGLIDEYIRKEVERNATGRVVIK